MKRLTIILAALSLGFMSQAQQDLTLYNMRYLQQSSFTNPANFHECKVHIGGIVFGSTAFRFGNSGFTLRNLTDFSRGIEGAGEALDKMNDLNYMDMEFRKDIIHFGFRVNKNYFGLNVSARTQIGLTYPQTFGTFLFLGNGLTEAEAADAGINTDYALLGKRASFDGTGVDATAWGEIGIRYARQFGENDQLVIGIRPKLLLGVANVEVLESQIGLKTNERTFDWTLDGSYSINSSLPFPYEDVVTFDTSSTGVITSDTSETLGDFNWNTFDNIGFGVDLGVTYNITEELQVSGSLIDLGMITWKQESTRTYRASDGRVKYSGVPLDGSLLGSATNFENSLKEFSEIITDSLLNQFEPTIKNESYTSYLTTRANVGVNYTIEEQHTLGLLVNGHLVKKKLRAAMTLSYNYRLRKWFGFHFNYSIYNRSFLNFGTGLSFNIFPWQFYIMTDNALGMVLPTRTKNIHLRGGINWTFGCVDDKDKDGIPDKEDDCPETPGPAEHKGCPDTDKDGIIDKFDKCPEVPGLVEYDGCPDRDGDGIIDDSDECPDTPGEVEFNGCPDTDKDGIKDSEDDCPEEAGIAAFNGCPDTDLDGIRDTEDDCPETPGIEAFNGCPDTDLDGIMDSEDDCPEKAGPAEYQGCPDTDEDGLPDNKDACPEKPGPIDNEGCPFGDRDGDGVIDKEDSCPDTPGVVENAGCPYSDLDGDGVFDKDDRCPQTPGIVENEGCPEIKQEEQEVLNTAFDALEFETGKDVIKATSYASLNELADLMIKKEEWKLQIAGHTDSQGSDAANMSLSEKRAKAVGKYLESRGVGTDQLVVKWFGETQPIADNSTAEGRAKNRRVEMEVIFD